MWWNFVLGQAQVNEQAGRGLLPELKNMFIAQCFRTNPTGKYLDKETGKEVIVNYASDIQTCLTTSIIFYGWLLMGVAAIVCFAYIVRAGYIMFTAFGDEAKYAEGKDFKLNPDEESIESQYLARLTNGQGVRINGIVPHNFCHVPEQSYR